jgi:hypothetical protein
MIQELQQNKEKKRVGVLFYFFLILCLFPSQLPHRVKNNRFFFKILNICFGGFAWAWMKS